MKTYTCIQCGNERNWHYVSKARKSKKHNKFCSNKCQGQHHWEQITKPRIEKGLGASRLQIRRFLIERDGENCSVCPCGPIWNNKPLSIQIDHIDGNSDNNDPKNLRLLCPNCHTQTETYGSKGMGNRYRKITKRNKALRKFKGYK